MVDLQYLSPHHFDLGLKDTNKGFVNNIKIVVGNKFPQETGGLQLWDCISQIAYHITYWSAFWSDK